MTAIAASRRVDHANGRNGSSNCASTPSTPKYTALPAGWENDLASSSARLASRAPRSFPMNVQRQSLLCWKITATLMSDLAMSASSRAVSVLPGNVSSAQS